MYILNIDQVNFEVAEWFSIFELNSSRLFLLAFAASTLDDTC